MVRLCSKKMAHAKLFFTSIFRSLRSQSCDKEVQMESDIFLNHRHSHKRMNPKAFDDWLNDRCVYITSHQKLRALTHKNDTLIFDWLIER